MRWEIVSFSPSQGQCCTRTACTLMISQFFARINSSLSCWLIKLYWFIENIWRNGFYKGRVLSTEYYVWRPANSLFLRFLLKFHGDKKYIWAGVGPHGGSPCPNTRRDKYMGVSFFLVSYWELKETFDDQIKRPKLSVVSMARELYINSILLCLWEFFWLMVEQYECFLFVDVLEQFWEVFTMSPKSSTRDIISSYNIDSSDF